MAKRTSPETPDGKGSSRATSDELAAWLASSGLPSVEEMAQQMLARGGPASLGDFASLGGFGRRCLEPTLQLPEPADEVRILRLRVDLDGTRPPVWRRVEVRSDLTMSAMHEVLQAVMGWTDSHLHRFWVGPTKQLWRGPHLVNHLDEDDSVDNGVGHESAVVVDQVLREPGDRVFYTYDFGDSWDHTLKLEAVRPAVGDEPPAVCLTGRRAGPLEDSGGVWGHEAVVAALGGGPPLDEWQADAVPAGYDPAQFDVDEVNIALSFVGLTADELFATISGGVGGRGGSSEVAAPVLHPALADLVSRAHGDDVASLAELTRLAHATAAGPGEEVHERPRTVPPLDTRGAVRLWQVLLDAAGDDGIPLTTAGWMVPAVVQEVWAALRLGGEWIGKGNREDLTPPVAAARTIVMQDGLLRRTGVASRPPLARDARHDPAALWRVVADGMIPRGAKAVGAFETDCSVLLLLHVAAGCPAGDDTVVEVAEVLVGAGWSGGGDGLTDTDVRRGATHAASRLAWVAGSRRSLPWESARAVQQALARAAIFPQG